MNIVLVPGVFGFSQLDPCAYFNGVTKHLQAAFPEANVHATKTAPGTIAHRADLLAQQIREGVFAGRLDSSQPFHLLAHSMGGLVARFLVAKNVCGMGRYVTTVTAIGTPHFGSPVASILDGCCSIRSTLRTLNIDDSLLAHLQANSVCELSSAAAHKFNAECPDDPRVQYFEVVGVGRFSLLQTSLFLLPTFMFLSAIAGPNDGMVPVVSATRNRQPVAVWPADHTDMIGHDLDGPVGIRSPSSPYLGAYESLVRRLVFSSRNATSIAPGGSPNLAQSKGRRKGQSCRPLARADRPVPGSR